MILHTLRKLRHGPLKFLGPFWVLCGSAFRKLLGQTGLFVEQSIGGYGPFHLDIRFAFSNFSSWGEDRHNDGFKACIEACRGKNCVFDIGAHIGLVSLPMASVLAPGGFVVSFEPAMANRTLLARHALRNHLSDTIRIEDGLIGEESGTEVAFHESSYASGMNSIATGVVDDSYHTVCKQQVSLDDYCFRHNFEPEIIKIDVEGAEIGVLNGARRILKKTRPIIFLSFHPKHVKKMGHSVADLDDILSGINYTCRHVDGSDVEKFALREYILIPEGQDFHFNKSVS